MQHNTKLLVLLGRLNHAHAPLLLTTLSGADTTYVTPFHCNFKFLAISICRTFRSMLHVPCISHTWLSSFVTTINVSTCRLSTAAILLYCAVGRSKIASWKHSIFCSIALNPSYGTEGSWLIFLSVCNMPDVTRRRHVSLFRLPWVPARCNQLIALGTPLPVPWRYAFNLSVGPSTHTHTHVRKHTQLSGSLHRTLQSSRLAACINTKEHKVCSVFCVLSLNTSLTDSSNGCLFMQSNVFCQVGTGLLNISRWT